MELNWLIVYGSVLSVFLQEHSLAYQLQFPHLSLSQETLQSKRIVLPFQELETKVAKLSLSGSMCVSAYLLQFPHLSLSQETLQSKRIVLPFQELETKMAKLSLSGSVFVCDGARGGGAGVEMDIKLWFCERVACFSSVQKLDDVTQPWEGKC
jgi:hypothetical protein